MLPDISKRKKLFGFSLKQFDSMKLREILDIKNHDGCTTNNCVEIVRGLNKYLEESKYLIVQGSVIFYFLKDISDKSLDDDSSAVIRLYAENIDYALVKTIMRNVMKIIKSLSSQRKFFLGVKSVIKVNRINKDWEILLHTQLRYLDERIMYLKNIIIPANLNYTPLGAYASYLDMRGLTVYDDIKLFIDNDGSIYDDTDAVIAPYKEHVLEILHSVDEETASALIEKAKEGMRVRDRRIDAIKKSVAKDEAEKMSKAFEDLKEIVFGLCSNAGKTFRSKRRSTLEKRARSCSTVWVVAAGRAKPFMTGYLMYVSTSGLASITTAERARIFNSEEEAEAAAESFRSKDDYWFAEVASVDLYSYSFDPYH